MKPQQRRKLSVSSLLKPSVFRMVWEKESDARWWRYQDTEPEGGEVDTSYFRKDYPFVPEARTKGPGARTLPELVLSRSQLRKRLSRRGFRGQALKQTVDNVQAAKGTQPFSGGLHYPLKGALQQVVGKRTAQKVLRGTRGQLLFIDEFAYFAQPLSHKLVESMRSLRKQNVGMATDVVAIA